VAAVGWLYRNNPFYKEDTWMNFSTRQHKHSWGIDLHAKAMYVGILAQSGTKLVHTNLPTTPEAFLRLLTP
jgi:transposase